MAPFSDFWTSYPWLVTNDKQPRNQFMIGKNLFRCALKTFSSGHYYLGLSKQPETPKLGLDNDNMRNHIARNQKSAPRAE